MKHQTERKRVERSFRFKIIALLVIDKFAINYLTFVSGS